MRINFKVTYTLNGRTNIRIFTKTHLANQLFLLLSKGAEITSVKIEG